MYIVQCYIRTWKASFNSIWKVFCWNYLNLSFFWEKKNATGHNYSPNKREPHTLLLNGMVWFLSINCMIIVRWAKCTDRFRTAEPKQILCDSGAKCCSLDFECRKLKCWILIQLIYSAFHISTSKYFAFHIK